MNGAASTNPSMELTMDETVGFKFSPELCMAGKSFNGLTRTAGLVSVPVVKERMMSDQTRNLNPHNPARAAMYLFGKRYSQQNGARWTSGTR
jgi:hypothetical protein